MRKADYATLARLIREAYKLAQAVLSNYPTMSESNPNRVDAQARADLCRALAVNFANRASVDRPAFLRACGIDDGSAHDIKLNPASITR